jgi:hypothetical protein
MPAPVVWALKLLVNYFVEWFYNKFRMETKKYLARKARRQINRGLTRSIREAKSEEERRDALDDLARGGLS